MGANAWRDEVDYSDERNLLIRSKAIREKCLDCVCQQRAEVRRCHIVSCPLWPWRFGGKGNVFDLARKGSLIKGPGERFPILKDSPGTKGAPPPSKIDSSSKNPSHGRSGADEI